MMMFLLPGIQCFWWMHLMMNPMGLYIDSFGLNPKK